MSAPAGCPSGYTAGDWRSLVAHRGEDGGEEPTGWTAAIEHVGLGRPAGHAASGCAVCRRSALAADPTLVFLRLGGEPLAAPASAVDPEVAAMQQAVAALRHASRLGGKGIGGSTAATPSGRRLDRGWARGAVRWSAAAGLAAVALTAGSTAPERIAPAVSLSVALPALPALPITAVDPLAQPTAVPAAMRVSPQQMPMVEDLNRPDARIYQIDGGNLSVVMIVDEKLDV